MPSVHPLIPTDVHGFTVTVGVGPYPDEDSPGQAMYAKLHPSTPETKERMAHKGRTMIVGALPISPAMADLILNGNEEATEYATYHALTNAARLAKEIGT